MDVGKMFMFGFEGYKPTKEILDFIRKEKLGGVILFKRNIKDAEQLKHLTAALQNAAGAELLIGIDQEGGRVANIPQSIMDLPPMEKLGNDFHNGDGLKHAHEVGHVLGNKLRQFGINIDFAPVLDVNTNLQNPIIGNRSFGSDPITVAALGSEVVRGMAQSGIIACGKHFPGHGDTSEDSHEALPILEHNRKRLNEIELVPFVKAIERNIPSLMSAHVVYRGVDSKNPATLSKKILTDILRREFNFEGVLFSDDLEMKAIADNYTMGDASVRAINAGCDILLVCHRPDRQREVIDAVKHAIDSGEIPEERLHATVVRIERMRAFL